VLSVKDRTDLLWGVVIGQAIAFLIWTVVTNQRLSVLEALLP